MGIRTPFHGDVSQRCPRSAAVAVLRPHLLGPTDSHFARDEGDTCEVKEADVVEWRGKVALSFSSRFSGDSEAFGKREFVTPLLSLSLSGFHLRCQMTDVSPCDIFLFGSPSHAMSERLLLP